MNLRKWSRLEDNRLRELCSTGKSREEISRIMNRPIGGINCRICRLKIAKRPPRLNEDHNKAMNADHDKVIIESIQNPFLSIMLPDILKKSAKAITQRAVELRRTGML